MTDLVGIASTLIGVTLLSLTAAGLVAAARLRGIAANVLAWAIMAAALLVFLAQILSEMHLIGRRGFLIGQIVLALLILPWSLTPAYRRFSQFLSICYRRGKPANQWLLANPALTLLGAFIGGSMLLGAYLIVIVPPNSTDGLFYHLPRVAHWLWSGTLHHFQSPLPQRTIFPINSEIMLLWLTALWGADRLGGFLQWLATLLAGMAIYGLARQLKFSGPAGLFAAFVWSSFTIVVIQATAVKNDIVVAFFFVASFYFLLAGLRSPKPANRANFIFFGLSFGLALGTKATALLALPAFGLLALVLVLYRPRLWPRLLYAGGWGIAGFVLVGAYYYGLNWLNFQSPFGPAGVSAAHLVQNPSLVSFQSNLGRMGYDLFDLSGLPETAIDLIRPWRALAGQHLFGLLAIEPNPPGTNFTREFEFGRGVLPPYEKNAWFGPLGGLLLLPTLLFYLFVSPFVERDIWKWLTALVPLVFVLVFAYFVRWQTQLGRMILMAVTLGTPLMAGFYGWSEKYKPLRWSLIALALVVLGWSATHNHHKPVLGSDTIWNLDYYELRLIRRPTLAPVARYVDANVPAGVRLGLAGDEALRPDRTDYLFWGPNLEREVIHVGPIPDPIDPELFERRGVDYLIFAAETARGIDSAAPLWPIGQDREARWFLASRSEMELFANRSGSPLRFQEAFGDDYLAYVAIETALQKEARPYRALTTDPRMPFYHQNKNFVFGIPEDLGDLEGFTHLIFAPQWSVEDYGDFNLSFEEIQHFLSQEKFVKKVAEVNGYTVYRLLF